jgi:phosphoribosyl 1,2-cyclic phosphate phosphodiesterase
VQKLFNLNAYFFGPGTSQGIPVIGSDHPVCKSIDTKDKRLRVSVWITWQEFSFIIDCGPDFRQQMLTSKCPKIDALFFTHEHSDHTAGIDDIRPFCFKQGKIPIYAHKRVLENLVKRFDYVFETQNKYPGAPDVLPIEVQNNQVIDFKSLTIVPINAFHGTLQIFGYRFGNFAYLTDVKTIDLSEIEKLKGVNVLVINALREEEHPTHFNLDEALHFVNLVQPKMTYLTHISHTFGFHEEVQKKLPKNVFLAYDNLTITI